MESVGGPPQKRRRTDEGSVAQANETLHIFMGSNQRQNRWMSGYVPKPEHEEVHVPVQTQNPAANKRRAVSDGQRLVQQPNAAGATHTSPTSPHPGSNSNLVQYESPMTNTNTPLQSNAPPLVNASSRKSMDRIPSGRPLVGLPSPVSSDGNGITKSPAITRDAPVPRRGRPSGTINFPPPGVAVPSNGSPMPRMQSPSQHQQWSQQHAHGGQVVYVNNQAMHVPSNAGARPQLGHSTLQSALSQLPQPTSSPRGATDWKGLLHRLDAFERNMMPSLRPGHVDRGRMTLLREAIEKHDWFYICLSQIHCLTVTPALLPEGAKQLPMQAVTYLDMLLCANSKLNPTVLAWLSDFPANIMSIYSSSAQVEYHRYVQSVVEFVQRLPLQWDKLVKNCKDRGAPPLMDDLLEKLALGSPALQTTVFRAIARMIKEDSDPLEQLHRMDQEGFARGRKRRTVHERAAAYQAYRYTIRQLTQYEERYRNANIRPDQRVRFVIPADALAVFQVGLPALPQQMQHPSTNHFNPAQQQQPPHMINQAMPHMLQRSTGSEGSPRQPSTSGYMHNGIMFPSLPRQQHPPSRRLVFPHESEQPRAQPTQPDTMRSALHQAHLRSPVLTPSKPESPRLYRYVFGFAVQPRKLNKDLPVETIGFDVAQELYDAIPPTFPSHQPGEPGSRTLTEKSCTLHLRCISVTNKALKSESSWMEADNYWPDNLYLQCNGRMLEQRRKLHHNRYLPIDLSALIKPGSNELTVIVNRMSTDKRPFEYALAVEIAGVVSHKAIGQSLKHISASESLAAIKKSLAGSDNEGDDITVTSSNTTIQLFDPYTWTKIFDIPVRSKSCLHTDCFDLETFLSQCEPRNKPGTPSVVDCWRCPICRGDVRPHTLVRDGFLDLVREELKAKGMLQTKAIVVEPDGSWKVKVEDVGGVKSPSLEREERGSSKTPSKGSVTGASAPKVVEIIEID